MTAKKEQFNFYADADVQEILKSVRSGLKACYINSAIRAYNQAQHAEQQLEDRLARLEGDVNALKTAKAN